MPMTPAQTASFAEHVRELRTRAIWVILFVIAGAALGYALHDQLLHLLQQPLHESLYYTTPTGAFSFVMKVCLVFGVITALPMLSYQTFAFFGPVIAHQTRRIFLIYVSASVFLAVAGILFAYFISLPAALHFLINFGNNGNIQALITANEYFNFVLAYIAGFAILFQLPLIIMFTNRFTPLPPKKLLGATKYVILASFVLAAIITPTPDPLNQALMAGPIILLYLCTVALVALSPRRYKRLRAIRKTLATSQAPRPQSITPATSVAPAGAPEPQSVFEQPNTLPTPGLQPSFNASSTASNRKAIDMVLR